MPITYSFAPQVPAKVDTGRSLGRDERRGQYAAHCGNDLSPVEPQCLTSAWAGCGTGTEWRPGTETALRTGSEVAECPGTVIRGGVSIAAEVGKVEAEAQSGIDAKDEADMGPENSSGTRSIGAVGRLGYDGGLDLAASCSALPQSVSDLILNEHTPRLHKGAPAPNPCVTRLQLDPDDTLLLYAQSRCLQQAPGAEAHVQLQRRSPPKVPRLESQPQPPPKAHPQKSRANPKPKPDSQQSARQPEPHSTAQCKSQPKAKQLEPQPKPSPEPRLRRQSASKPSPTPKPRLKQSPPQREPHSTASDPTQPEQQLTLRPKPQPKPRPEPDAPTPRKPRPQSARAHAHAHPHVKRGHTGRSATPPGRPQSSRSSPIDGTRAHRTSTSRSLSPPQNPAALDAGGMSLSAAPTADYAWGPAPSTPQRVPRHALQFASPGGSDSYDSPMANQGTRDEVCTAQSSPPST